MNPSRQQLSYVMTIVAVAAAGNRGAPKRLAFSVR